MANVRGFLFSSHFLVYMSYHGQVTVLMGTDTAVRIILYFLFFLLGEMHCMCHPVI